VPTPDNESSDRRGINWPAVLKTLLFQVLVLLALAGAFVGYIEWSSDAAFEEFVAASKPAVKDPKFHLQSATPVMTVKGQAPCAPKG
jgi:hypothetical protein